MKPREHPTTAFPHAQNPELSKKHLAGGGWSSRNPAASMERHQFAI